MEEDKLRSLFVVCKLPECRAAIDPDEVIFRYTGAALNVTATCNNNHTEHWDSSSSVGEGRAKHFIINVLLVRTDFHPLLHFRKYTSRMLCFHESFTSGSLHSLLWA